MGQDNKFKVESNIPIPKNPGVTGRQPIYPLAKMEKGDSIFIEGKHTNNLSNIYTYGQRHGKKFTIKKVDGGVRVWRFK